MALGVIVQDRVMVFLYHRSCCVGGVVVVTLYVQLCNFGLTDIFSCYSSDHSDLSLKQGFYCDLQKIQYEGHQTHLPLTASA